MGIRTFIARKNAVGSMALGMLGSILSSTGHADATGTFMQVLERTSIPAGHVYYCAREPEACKRYGEGMVALNQQSWDQLVEINARVNRSIKPVEDGEMDVWSVYVNEGDCEDFALTKQRELLRAGWPSDALLLTTAYLSDGTYHAVLVVRTHWGEFVLDNLNPLILPWQEVKYHWNKRQAVGNPHVWQRIAGAPVTDANQPLAGLKLRPAQP